MLEYCQTKIKTSVTTVCDRFVGKSLKNILRLVCHELVL